MKPASPGRRFRVLAGRYAVCRLPPRAPVPDWATGRFLSCTRTRDELSIIGGEKSVPAGVRAERGWRVLQVIGPLPFSAVGILAAVAGALARAGVSVLAIATHDTDYFLVRDADLERAVGALAAAGFRRVR